MRYREVVEVPHTTRSLPSSIVRGYLVFSIYSPALEAASGGATNYAIYPDTSDRRYPVVYVLHGHSGASGPYRH